MTPRFLKFTKEFIFLWECVFRKGHYGDLNQVVMEDDPDDPGGRTKWGIDQRSHPKEDIKNLTMDRALEIYFKEYWQANKCETMPLRLSDAHYNACVNTGAGRANKFLAAAGRSTLKYLAEQDAFYRRLAAARPRSKKFLKGWLNRTSALRKYLGL